MIEKMKIVQIVSLASGKEKMLNELRSLGLVHFAEKHSADKVFTDKFAELSRISQYLKDYEVKGGQKTDILDDEAFEKIYSRISNAINDKQRLTAERSAAVTESEKLRVWGYFDPQEIRKLESDGIMLNFYILDRKTFAEVQKDETVSFIRLEAGPKNETIAVLGVLPGIYPSTELSLPEKGLRDLEKEIADCDSELKKYEEIFAEGAKYQASFNDQMLKVQNQEYFSSVNNTACADEGLVWLSGYIPEADIDQFRKTAADNSWAYAIDDPAEDDEFVPTKVKYSKISKLMIPVFDILGTVPGYHEYDISFWFLCFFTLFFAMIIGDAGYGVTFLIGAILLQIKGKKLTDLVMLVYVLSIGTIIWGSLTGTWFGLEGAMKIPLLKSLVIPSFANYPEYFGVETTAQQNAIMKFCFIIGVVQLVLACVMNVKRKLKEKDLSLVADIGWLIAIVALYFIVMFLVIGEAVNLIPVAIFVGIGFILVVCFGGMSPDKSFAEGLKAGLGDAFTTFLNTISAFGNIMSYIRLFAVGMASLAIAQSFNNMAAGFKGPLVIIGAIIMIIGHVLNLVMGLLSVVVHGIRLNLLEFSGQLGMEWSGIAYNPFRKLDKIKK